MRTDTVSIQKFVSENKINLTSEYASINPNMEGSSSMDNYKVVLTRRKYTAKRYNARKDGTSIVARMTTFFSKGIGHHGAEPTVEEVLDCLSSDASGIENARDFEDFCNEYGYSSDSRKAEKIYRECQHSASRLRKFLGDDLYDQLLWHTERE